ncbi:MAG: FliH/SctL family protein [Dissulfurimicrobium sp.]|uniref:FliH/SctL family protein n=1 Tax=Dissulfurimicrobium sp. TaxID=2022436 RepID=UPI0040495686
MSRVIKADMCLEMNLHKLALPQQGNGQMEGDDNADIFSPFCQLVDDKQGINDPGIASDGGVLSVDGHRSADLNMSNDVMDVKVEANALKKEAETILENARKMAARIEAEAYDQGYAQGWKDGESLGRREYENKCSRLEDIINAIQSQADAIINRYESQLVRLCMEIARHIVHHEIEIMPETIIMSLKEALKQVVEGSELNIRLNPRDAELVHDFVEKKIKVTCGHPVNITPDSRISAGGCIIETDFGLIDATVDGKWQAVASTIKKTLNARLKGNDGYAD